MRALRPTTGWILALTLSGALSYVGCRAESQPVEPKLATGYHAPEPENLDRLLSLTLDDSIVGELVYVPVYSSVYHQRGERGYFLTATLSIHNIDLRDPIRVSEVNYYDTDGRRIREFVEKPLVLGPLATKQFVIPSSDKTGGSGANFIVKWEAPREMPSPLIEAVMISTVGQQGISFLTHGSVIRHWTRESTMTSTAPTVP